MVNSRAMSTLSDYCLSFPMEALKECLVEDLPLSCCRNLTQNVTLVVELGVSSMQIEPHRQMLFVAADSSPTLLQVGQLCRVCGLCEPTYWATYMYSGMIPASASPRGIKLCSPTHLYLSGWISRSTWSLRVLLPFFFLKVYKGSWEEKQMLGKPRDLDTKHKKVESSWERPLEDAGCRQI